MTRDPVAPVVRIAHLSDIHFGRIAHPGIVSALVDEVNAERFDLVVASGDLTQRARRHEFREARAMLDAFEAPVLVVPGNHDVRAWWHNPYERVWGSTKRFTRFVSDDLTPHVVHNGTAVFGLNSAHGLTIKGGRIRTKDLAAMESFFEQQPSGTFRVLVLHHHLRRLAALGDHDVSVGAQLALAAAQRAGVELVLCGHLHRSHVAPIGVSRPGTDEVHRIVIASAGTATSSRGRGDDTALNYYNWIAVEPERFLVQERLFDSSTCCYATVRETPFDRLGQ